MDLEETLNVVVRWVANGHADKNSRVVAQAKASSVVDLIAEDLGVDREMRERFKQEAWDRAGGLWDTYEAGIGHDK